MKRSITFFLLFVLSGALTTATAQQNKHSKATLIEVAQQFYQTLNHNQPQLIYDFEDSERYNWHFIPRDRNGLPLKAMNDDQQQAAMHLLRASLSQAGYQKAKDVMELENILRMVENRPANDTYRDPNNYYFTVFGNLQPGEAWGWRLEGHHLSLNFSTLSNELTSATPTFFGANPANVPSGPKKGWRILQPEEDVASALVKSLNQDQLKVALIAEEAYPDIITGTEIQAQIGNSEGLAYAQMSSEQQDQLMQLLKVYYRYIGQR